LGRQTGRQLGSIPSRIVTCADALSVLGERLENFYSRIPVLQHLKKPRSLQRNETPQELRPLRTRLRFHLEDNAASAGLVAGATGVEVATFRCRTEHITLVVDGNVVVQWSGPIAFAEEGI
jgi:hypothetical protein